ncbi:tubulin-folding cofactor E isoform X2 [Daucus carota subsp. sativus]|uniref:tubulin-folding cofactor E isoform X2 n=1 Tax=Daucus carota subsp. sativus TaxID=79200 RepID=UPI003083D088
MAELKIGQRVHSVGDCRRIGTVKYVGEVEGYSGEWVGIEWDNDAQGKHDGSVNGVRYFQAKSATSASFVRPHKLSSGISFLQALDLRYRSTSTKEEEDEMYVLSATNRRVSVQLLGKDKIQNKLNCFEDLTSASLFYLGVSSCGPPSELSVSVPNLKELDLTGNLLSEWEVELLKDSLPLIEELHLMGNKVKNIQPTSSTTVQGFIHLRLLNLEDNCLADWNEILKLSHLQSLEQLHLNKNDLNCIRYPDNVAIQKLASGCESFEKDIVPFQNLCCLLLGGNNIGDLASVDSLNSFPRLTDIRLSGNPVSDPGKGGIARYVLIARLAKVHILNGSEISPRERKDSEIRYVRSVISELQGNQEVIKQRHPRFFELKTYHGIEDERPSSQATVPQKMASGLLSITLKCVGASIGEKPPMTKKLPASTTVGKLKNLSGSFFRFKAIKPRLFLQEEGSPLPLVLDDDMASLTEAGVCNDSTILIDEEN